MEISIISIFALSSLATAVMLGACYLFISRDSKEIERLNIRNAELFFDNSMLNAQVVELKNALDKSIVKCKLIEDKDYFFNRFISPAYVKLDSDKQLLCKSLGVTKEEYDNEMRRYEGLEETLLTYRVHDLLLESGYLYSKKFKNRFSTGECDNCNQKINKLIEEIQDVTQSECHCKEKFNGEFSVEDISKSDALSNETFGLLIKNAKSKNIGRRKSEDISDAEALADAISKGIKLKIKASAKSQDSYSFDF
jgi:hypothetical protein